MFEKLPRDKFIDKCIKTMSYMNLSQDEEFMLLEQLYDLSFNPEEQKCFWENYKVAKQSKGFEYSFNQGMYNLENLRRLRQEIPKILKKPL